MKPLNINNNYDFISKNHEYQKLLALRPDLTARLRERIGFTYILQKQFPKALEELNLGTVMKRLDPDAVDGFLAKRKVAAVRYPDVARMIADWIGAGNWKDFPGLSCLAWGETIFANNPQTG